MARSLKDASYYHPVGPALEAADGSDCLPSKYSGTAPGRLGAKLVKHGLGAGNESGTRAGEVPISSQTLPGLVVQQLLPGGDRVASDVLSSRARQALCALGTCRTVQQPAAKTETNLAGKSRVQRPQPGQGPKPENGYGRQHG